MAKGLKTRFQSHNGSIATLLNQQLQDALTTGFNPIMVRLRQNRGFRAGTRSNRFNPIMVRLRQ